MSAIAPEREPNRRSGPLGGRLAFPRSVRLLRHADFERVYKQGRRHFSATMTIFYLQRQPSTAAQPVANAGPRIGFTVGRALGGAVERNRIKRRLREAVRLTLPETAPAMDVVINPKKALLKADFAAVQNEVRRAFVVISQKAAAKNENVPLAGALKDSGGRGTEG